MEQNGLCQWDLCDQTYVNRNGWRIDKMTEEKVISVWLEQAQRKSKINIERRRNGLWTDPIFMISIIFAEWFTRLSDFVLSPGSFFTIDIYLTMLKVVEKGIWIFVISFGLKDNSFFCFLIIFTRIIHLWFRQLDFSLTFRYKYWSLFWSFI